MTASPPPSLIVDTDATIEVADPASELIPIASPTAGRLTHLAQPDHRMSLRDALIAQTSLTNDDYNAAETEAAADVRNRPVTQVLIDAGRITRKDVFRATATTLGLEFLDLLDAPLDPDVYGLLTPEQARKYNVIPYRLDGDTLHVVTSPDNTSNWETSDDLRTITKADKIVFAIAVPQDLHQRINLIYRAEAEMSNLVRTMVNEDTILDLAATADGESPVVRYVNLMLEQAIADGASDIHIEPMEQSIRIRYRIDGVLVPMTPAPKEIQPAIISRIKIMCDMDIAEKRKPQDGRLSVMHQGRRMDLRVNAQPTVWGEKVVMRILDNSHASLALTDLGFSAESLTLWQQAYSKPYGMMVVSGPTGSGKSTTLYGTVNAISRDEINIVTVEDPVEYRIPGINQIQINSKAGTSFATSLRSILRADPDVILIGEIRDHETAQIAIESALTGHLVLTTLHTNDAPSVITRLIEMGIEPFLVSSALTCISGQRLARRLCTKCRRPATVSQTKLDLIGFTVPEGVTPTFYEKVGCPACANTGYRGRIGIHEVMLTNEDLAAKAATRAHADELRDIALGNGMRPLREDGWIKVALGITTIEEVLRVIA